MDNVYVARQPIFNKRNEVFAYELLFRGGEDHQSAMLNGDEATSHVIINAFLEVGLDTILGNKPGFINFTRNFLTGDIPIPLSPKEAVIEVLEDIEPEPRVLETLQRYRKQGYIIALDDFIHHDNLRPFLELAHLVKIDLMAYGGDLEAMAADVEKIRPYKLKLLAEKVETREEFEFCKRLGFDLYQGYYFSKPQLHAATRKVGNNRLVMLKLLARLQDPATQFEELGQMVSQDGPFVHRLLRYINSAGTGLGQRVDSVQQALTLLGTQTIKNWITLLLMTRATSHSPELMRTSLIRARMCELLAQQTGLVERDRAFTVGLLSALDGVMNEPMESLLGQLPLTEDIQTALLNHEGPLGRMLHCVKAYELGDYEVLDSSPIGSEFFSQAYLDALKWAQESLGSIKE